MDDRNAWQRAELIERALRVLPSGFPFDLLSDRDIRLAAIESMQRGDELEQRSPLLNRWTTLSTLTKKADDYVAGVFDAAIERLEEFGLSRRSPVDKRKPGSS